MDEAVSRISFKFSAGLQGIPSLLECIWPADEAFEKELYQRVPTLVKDTQNLLPLSPEKHRKFIAISGGIFAPLSSFYSFSTNWNNVGRRLLGQCLRCRWESWNKCLWFITLIVGEEILLTCKSAFIDWLKLMDGLSFLIQRFWHEVPTTMIFIRITLPLWCPTCSKLHQHLFYNWENAGICSQGNTPWKTIA